MGSFSVLENSKKITCGHELFYNSPRAESINLLQTATCNERNEKEAIKKREGRIANAKRKAKMSQESAGSAAAAMNNISVDDVQPMRSDSELLAAAAELDAEIESNKDKASGGSSGSPAGNPAGLVSRMESEEPLMQQEETGKCDSSIGDSSGDENDAEAARAAFETEVKKVIAAGRAAGLDVKKKAAEYFVEEAELLAANDKTIGDCVRNDGSKKIYKQDVVAVVDAIKMPVPVRREESEWAASLEVEEELDEDDEDYLEGKSIKELTEMQAEKAIELEGIEGKLASGAMSLMFKEFARGAKKEANASELKALSDKVKLEIEKPFFKGLGKVGHELMIKVHTAAIEESELPAAADGLRVELRAIKSAKAAAKAAKEEAKEQEELKKLMDKKRTAQASGSTSKRRK